MRKVSSINRSILLSIISLLALAVATADAMPVAEPGGPYTVFIGGLLALDGSGSYDTGHVPIVNWEWSIRNDEIWSNVPGIYRGLTHTVGFNNLDADYFSVHVNHLQEGMQFPIRLRVTNWLGSTATGMSSIRVTAAPVPESHTLTLLGFGLIGLAATGRRRREGYLE